MPQERADKVDWPILFGRLITAGQRIKELDPDEPEVSAPRPAATEAEIAALEQRVGERVDPYYRDFLLHANGWPKVFFEVGLFGVPELDGGGDWSIAGELLTRYRTDGTLAACGLQAAGVVPIATGPDTDHLIVMVRAGWPNAGQVVWIDIEEFDRADNFAEFFVSLVSDKEEYLADLAE